MHTSKNVRSAKGFSSPKPYSTGRAIFSGFFISAVLWWIPFIGPVAAGYYAGRKSGSFIKGAISSAFAGGLLLATIVLASHYILGPEGFPGIAVESAAGALTGYLVWVGMYLEYFYNAGTANINLVPFGILIAFGCLGGSFSALYRSEATALMAQGAVNSAIRPMARSAALYEQNKKLGFESFNDCVSIRDSVVSINMGKKDRPKANSDRQRNVTDTVRTVTTTVNEGSTPTASATNKGNRPFSDILALAEVRDSGRLSSKK